MTSHKILQSTVAKKLETLRKKREFTMSGLAERSGVSKGTLSVLEDGGGNPTISTLWNIAEALDVPFNELINSESQPSGLQKSADGISVQLIEKTNANSPIEAYHMTLEPNSHREAPPHPPGVEEQITVLSGHMLTGSIESPKLISTGEHYTFKADKTHIYSASIDKVTAIVTVQYPEDKTLSSEHTIIRSAPTNNEEWERLLILIQKHSIEVANGLPIFRLVVRTGSEPEIITRNIKARLLGKQNNHFKAPISIHFVEEKEQVFLYIFPKSKGYSYTPAKSDNDTPAINAAKRDILPFITANTLIFSEAQKNTLRNVAETGNLLNATLAAEALSIQGEPTLPHSIKGLIDKQQKVNTQQSKLDDTLFESHLNPHRYNAYELLHPGYARYVLAIGEMLLKYGNKDAKVLDIGTGSGLFLLMLLDSIPALNVTAIEPNPSAFSYLEKNTKNVSLNLHCCDFLAFEADIKYPVITLTDASHCLNTAFFLQKAHSLLDDNGILIIADAFLPPFGTEKERNRALINHHIAYMLDVLNIMLPDPLSDAPLDYKVIEPYAKALPAIAFLGQTNSIDSAISHLRILLETVQANPVEATQPNSLLLGFCSVLTLELEALLAGIDYDVERKTSAENFFALAESAGFVLEEHQRTYATSGRAKTEGGTHVFAFKKAIQ